MPENEKQKKGDGNEPYERSAGKDGARRAGYVMMT